MCVRIVEGRRGRRFLTEKKRGILMDLTDSRVYKIWETLLLKVMFTL
jgi:hypothetical protein